ncbi:MAG: hypothetical protein QXY45_00270 [Candidatus Aenigmatarchaeota archaeon]
MPDVFTIVILKLREMGAFNFLFPFMLTTAIFYGLLRRSKIFSIVKKQYRREKTTQKLIEEEVEVGTSINAIIALIAGFMVWAYPILSGINVEEQLASFFMHGIVATLVLIVAIIMTSMFLPPNIPEQLKKALGESKVAIVLLACVIIGVIIFVTSGLLNLIVGPVLVKLDLGNDTILTLVVLALLILPLIFIFREGVQETPQEEKKGENS